VSGARASIDDWGLTIEDLLTIRTIAVLRHSIED